MLEVILRGFPATGVIPLRKMVPHKAIPKKMKMKTRNFLITLSVAALATVNVMATDALLSPRAAEQQIKMASGFNTDPDLTASRPTSVSPRLFDNQIKTVAGKSSVVSPTLNCVRYMTGTPKQISACADHPGAPMPCCSVASMK
jgi:hypothetical protein